MFRLHPRSTLTYTLFPYPTLFRSADVFEHIARELRHQHAPERARRAADPDHRSHRPAREHIRDEREEVGRPRLMRRRREPHDQHRDPQMAHPVREEDRRAGGPADDTPHLTPSWPPTATTAQPRKRPPAAAASHGTHRQ